MMISSLRSSSSSGMVVLISPSALEREKVIRLAEQARLFVDIAFGSSRTDSRKLLLSYYRLRL